eukprot:IDg16302t1
MLKMPRHGELERFTTHFNLRQPKPYNPVECNARHCSGPCPLLKTGQSSSPTAIWRRGQRVTIEWHKNNHRDGFYRRSLVPVSKMNNWAAHDATAFDWGCWSQNAFQCGHDP